MLDDGINPHIKLCKVGAGLLELASSSGIRVHVCGLAEEVSSETLVGVVKNSVLAGVAERGGILDAECNLPDEVTLGSLGRAGFLGLLVPDFAGFLGITWLDSGDTEGGSPGATLSGLAAEEFLKASAWKVGPSLVNRGHIDGSLGGARAAEGCLLACPVIRHFAEGGSKSGGSDEGHDVGVVAECEDLLGRGGLIPGAGSDANGLTDSEVWELQLKSKGVPDLSRAILELKFVGVGVHLVHSDDLGNNIKVGVLGLCLVQWLVHVFGDSIVGGEVGASPLFEVGNDGSVGLVARCLLA